MGHFGTYTDENDDEYDYYVYKCIEKLFEVEEVEEDGEIDLPGKDYVSVFKSDWVCRGVWLENLPVARNW